MGVIGVTCEVRKLRPYFSRLELLCDYDYIRSVLRAHGTPVMLPINPFDKELNKILDILDGIIIVGGHDIHPSFYRERPAGSAKTVYRGRVYFEKRLYKAAVRRKIPVLGICYGLQLINIVHGGTLYQDIRSHIRGALNHQSRANRLHQVTVDRKSLCYRIFREDSFMVHSDHHQAVKMLGRGLRISAVAPDGIVEAIEYPPHVIAVQWHPERQPKDIVQARLFSHFAKRIYRRNR
ncbi:MAG: gamma-glutamyl-gamma-aminobutyrate hydrolase family protein [Candidatus Omnitrophota bacterium]